MANAHNSNSNPNPRTVPADLAPGLDLFAATWLELWSDASGSVQLGADGLAIFGFRDYHDSTDFVAANPDIPEWAQTHHATFRDGHYHGKMRALLALLKALPCGSDAVKSHLRAHGIGCYYAGRAGAES